MRNGDTFEFSKFGRSKTARSCDHFILTFVQFAHQERRENALTLEAGRQFVQAVFIKTLPWIAQRRQQGQARRWRESPSSLWQADRASLASEPQRRVVLRPG